jgi:hypothetical protein
MSLSAQLARQLTVAARRPLHVLHRDTGQVWCLQLSREYPRNMCVCACAGGGRGRGEGEGEGGSVLAYILIKTRWRRVVSFTLRPVYSIEG